MRDFAILDLVDAYFFIVVGLIVFSLLVIFYVRFSRKGEPELEKTDHVIDAEDFTILE